MLVGPAPPALITTGARNMPAAAAIALGTLGTGAKRQMPRERAPPMRHGVETPDRSSGEAEFPDGSLGSTFRVHACASWGALKLGVECTHTVYGISAV